MEKKERPRPIGVNDSTAMAFREQLPKAQHKSFDKLADLMQRPETSKLRWWHDVGKRALILQPAGERRYSKQFIGRMALALTGEGSAKRTTNRLYQARQLVRSFTDKEINPLQENIKNGQLRLRHVFSVCRAPAVHRKALLEACRKEHWTIQQLERAIHHRLGYRKGAGGHRLHPPPKDQPLPVVIRDVTNQIRAWQTYAAVWLKGEGVGLRQEPTMGLEGQLRRELDRALARFSDFEQSVKAVGQRLRKLDKASQSTTQPSRRKNSRSPMARSKSRARRAPRGPKPR